MLFTVCSTFKIKVSNICGKVNFSKYSHLTGRLYTIRWILYRPKAVNIQTSLNSNFVTSHAYRVDDNFDWCVLLPLCSCLIYGSYTILIHLCEVDGKLPFSSASIVLVTEILKVFQTFVWLIILLFAWRVCDAHIKIHQLSRSCSIEYWICCGLLSVIFMTFIQTYWVMLRKGVA